MSHGASTPGTTLREQILNAMNKAPHSASCNAFFASTCGDSQLCNCGRDQAVADVLHVLVERPAETPDTNRAWREGAELAGHGQPMPTIEDRWRGRTSGEIAAFEMGYAFIHSSDVAKEMTRRIDVIAKRASEAETRLADLPTGTDWQPIETAPKLTSVLVYMGGTAGLGIYRAILAKWGSADERWRPVGYTVLDEFPRSARVTHWMPLPAAPAKETT